MTHNTVADFITCLNEGKLKEVNNSQLLAYLNSIPRTPETKYRTVKVVHRIVPAGQHIPVVSMRNAIFMGQKPTNITFDRPYTIRELHHKRHGVWMTDAPQEVWQMREPLLKCYGHVLVGGLGLGVFPWLLTKYYGAPIKSITVIENDPNIIKVIAPYIKHKKIEVVQADLFKYVKQKDIMRYDSAFLDIWQGTGEITWEKFIVPLRRAIGTKIPTVLCWNEEEMLGQFDYLARVAHLDRPTNGPGEVFRRYCQENGIIGPKDTMTSEEYQATFFNAPDPKVATELQGFLRAVGMQVWEDRFGELWDEEMKKGGAK